MCLLASVDHETDKSADKALVIQLFCGLSNMEKRVHFMKIVVSIKLSREMFSMHAHERIYMFVLV